MCTIHQTVNVPGTIDSLPCGLQLSESRKQLLQRSLNPIETIVGAFAKLKNGGPTHYNKSGHSKTLSIVKDTIIRPETQCVPIIVFHSSMIYSVLGFALTSALGIPSLITEPSAL